MKTNPIDKMFEKPTKVQEIKPLPKLHPPKEIISEVKETSHLIPETIEIKTIVKIAIDEYLEELAKSSDHIRDVYRTLKGKSWRGKDADCKKEVEKTLKIIQDPSFAGLIKEMKENFSNGFVRPSQIK